MSVPVLTLGAKRRLLEIARQAILYRLQRGSVPPFARNFPELDAEHGVFVSLLTDGAPRGCMGTIDAGTCLRDAVRDMAVAAATEDPGFAALTSAELLRTNIEVTILTRLEPIAPDAIEPGRHGLYISFGSRRGVLLPQVAPQFGWSRETLLDEAVGRVGLEEGAWRDSSVAILGFEALVFSDLDLVVAASEGSSGRG